MDKTVIIYMKRQKRLMYGGWDVINHVELLLLDTVSPCRIKF